MTTIADAMTLADQHQQAGNLPQAEALYRQVLAVEPQHLNARYRLAVVCHMQGRMAEAIVLYQQLLQIQPDTAQVQNNLGLAYSSQGRLAEALACCAQAVRLMPDCAEFFNNLGTIHNSRGEHEQARDAFRQALALKPDYPSALSNLGGVYLAQGRWDEAVQCLQEAVAQQPNNALVLNNLGNAFLAQGKAVDAANCYRQALRLLPNYAEAAANLAKVRATLQQWEDAAADLQNRLAHHAEDPTILTALGDLYYYHLDKHAEALRCYRQVLALCPDDAKARLLVAVLSGDARFAQVPGDYVTELYDSLAVQFDQKGQQRGDRSPEWLKAALEPAPPARSLAVLDLGCGTGLCGVQLRDWAATLIGVDLSPNMLAKARDRNLYDELIAGDVLTAVQARPGQFDLIVASDVLLFLGDLGPLFAAVQQALRPGGRFAFTIDLHEGADDYRLTPWLHFAHSRTYLRNLASATHLQESYVKEVQFPREGGKQAAGLVMVLHRR
jgi:predicted TPR repeat methyltransferase